MNRETKIGLLVGLAFILVIGILLSDHVTRSTQPPEAALTNVTNDVMRGVNTPSQPGGPAIITPPERPRQPVPTREDIDTLVVARNPDASVILEPEPLANADGIIETPAPDYPTNGQTMLAASDDAFSGGPFPGSAFDTRNVIESGVEVSRVIQASLAQTAARLGEELEYVDPTGRRLPIEPRRNGPISQGPGSQGPISQGPIVLDSAEGRGPILADTARPTNRSLGVSEYVAQPGDNLTRMAKKVFGESTPETRNLLRSLNPDLDANPNLVVVGRAYKVPADTSRPEARRPLRDTPAGQAAARPAALAYRSYTVEPGDSLWIIARDEVGDVGAIDAIKELNRTQLAGGETIQPGMTLKLPR
ncbi:MAG: LysM peptidoglycan-binding domain-containing protein [Phycisphaerae bacterium]